MDYGLEMLTRPAWIEVDLAALRENFANIKGLLPEGLPIVAVVKADAYGHGAVQVAECLLAEGASRLAVAIACSPATPAPKISALAGGTVPAAVIISGTALFRRETASITAA